MSAFEKAMLSLTGAFLLFCAALLLLQTSAAAVSCEGCTVYTEGGAAHAPSGKSWTPCSAHKAVQRTRKGASTSIPPRRRSLPRCPASAKRAPRASSATAPTTGPFEDASYLRDVTGIGDGLYTRIADLILPEPE